MERCFAEGFSVRGPMVPCPNILTIGTCSCGLRHISPDIILNDQKIGHGQQGSMGASPLQAGAVVMGYSPITSCLGDDLDFLLIFSSLQ